MSVRAESSGHQARLAGFLPPDLLSGPSSSQGERSASARGTVPQGPRPLIRKVIRSICIRLLINCPFRSTLVSRAVALLLNPRSDCRVAAGDGTALTRHSPSQGRHAVSPGGPGRMSWAWSTARIDRSELLVRTWPSARCQACADGASEAPRAGPEALLHSRTVRIAGNRIPRGHVPISRAAGAAGLKCSDTLPRPQFLSPRCVVALHTLLPSRR